MKIRKTTIKDNVVCLKIAKALPEWFNEKGILEIVEDLSSLTTYVFEEDKILAYACIKNKSDKVVEIKQLAVDRDSQRHGIGTELIAYIAKVVAPGKIIEVKTLDESCEYKPYIETRSFYEKNGFIKVEVIDPYPGWGNGNPCAIYIKFP